MSLSMKENSLKDFNKISILQSSYQQLKSSLDCPYSACETLCLMHDKAGDRCWQLLVHLKKKYCTPLVPKDACGKMYSTGGPTLIC